MGTPRVFFDSPSNKLSGVSFVVPRWQYVLATATPTDLVGDPIIHDESLEPFDVTRLKAGDIVGISIMTENCMAGYRTLRAIKQWNPDVNVVMGGVHATFFPEEPLTMGADAVVTGDGDVVWKTVVKDALEGKLQKLYEGGNVPEEELLPARWDLLAESKYLTRYMLATLQTLRGCPKNCNFCSVWIADGRSVRFLPTANIIREANQLIAMGFRFVGLAEDNATPGVLPAIEYEMKHGSPARARELERVRERRLTFFDDYAKGVKDILPAFTQMTSEGAGDPVYLKALHDKMGVRGALIGVESFTQEGLASARKEWNPVGKEMVRAIQTIQGSGIQVLSSIICGLETDTVQTLATMRTFAKESGTLIAQFPMYQPIPGTVDYLEMRSDLKQRESSASSALVVMPKHRTQLLKDEYWLDPERPRVLIKHPSMNAEVLSGQVDESWDDFYAPLAVFARAMKRDWGFIGRIILILASLAFRELYRGQGGISSDCVRVTKTGPLVRIFLGLSIRLMRKKSLGKKNPGAAIPATASGD